MKQVVATLAAMQVAILVFGLPIIGGLMAFSESSLLVVMLAALVCLSGAGAIVAGIRTHHYVYDWLSGSESRPVSVRNPV